MIAPTAETYVSRLISVLFVFSALCVFGCRENAPAPGTGADRGNDQEDEGTVVALLETMPDWTMFGATDEHAEDRAKIKVLVTQVCTHDLDVIRSAMSRYRLESWRKGGLQGVAADGKIMIVTRFLFDVPATIRYDSPHFPALGGRWMGSPISGDLKNPTKSDIVDMRWPWSVDKAGQWKLTGKYGGFFTVPYPLLDIFDYCRKHFGKRKCEERG